METIELNAAVSDIKGICDNASQDNRHAPFFLVVGAGISSPPIPLASEIVEECKKIVNEAEGSADHASSDPIDEYSKWLGKAFPSARDRQGYFRRLIENKAISVANLRVAHLLSAKRLSDFVVTPNFDDFLSRALRLFGITPIVCDHPATVARIDEENRDDLQIMHVHGSYLFYDCANLRLELKSRASVDNTRLTIVAFLQNLLYRRSPIVVGYAGWEGDPIMTALERRCRDEAKMRANLYWCCYTRESLNKLPSWLIKRHEKVGDVQFVIAPERPAYYTDPQATRVSPEAFGLIENPATAAGARRVLDAREVFEAFGAAFRIDDPPLLANPLKSFADQLEASLPSEGNDPYGCKRLVGKIRAAESLYTRQSQVPFTAEIDEIIAAMRRSRYAEAIRASAELIERQLDPGPRQELLRAASMAGEALLDREIVNEPLLSQLAKVHSLDPTLEELLKPIDAGTAFVFPARAEQRGTESPFEGAVRGAFSFHLEEAIRSEAERLELQKTRIRELEEQLDRANYDQKQLQLGHDRQRRQRRTKASSPVPGLEESLSQARKHYQPRSLQRLVADASCNLLTKSRRQCGVVVGDGSDISLFVKWGKPASRKHAAGELRILLVGVDQSPLSGCSNDVNAFNTLLNSFPELFGKPRIAWLLDKNATEGKVLAALKKLARKRKHGESDLLLFYFAGRLVRSYGCATALNVITSVPSLAAYDYDGKSGGEIPLAKVLELLRSSNAIHKVVILD